MFTTPAENEIYSLLERLCVKLGFCLPSSVSDRLAKFPPKTAVRFAQSVLKAEGLSQEFIEKRLYKSILTEIENVFAKYE